MEGFNEFLDELAKEIRESWTANDGGLTMAGSDAIASIARWRDSVDATTDELWALIPESIDDCDYVDGEVVDFLQAATANFKVVNGNRTNYFDTRADAERFATLDGGEVVDATKKWNASTKVVSRAGKFAIGESGWTDGDSLYREWFEKARPLRKVEVLGEESPAGECLRYSVA